VLTATDEDTALAVEVVPGQRHEASYLELLLNATAACVPDLEEVVGDEGFDGARQRRACRERGARPVIPYNKNWTKPGRLDKGAYRQRNRVERLVGKLKEFRRVATRYEKLKATFLGMIHLALGFIP
jgi:transposase